MRFEEDERIAEKIDTFNRQQEVELQWIDVLHPERVGMLFEEERRLIGSGGSIEGSFSKREVSMLSRL